MSNMNNRNETIPERNRNQEQIIDCVQRDNEIMHKGCIDNIKANDCIRWISVHARRLDPSNNVKIERFIESVE